MADFRNSERINGKIFKEFQRDISINSLSQGIYRVWNIKNVEAFQRTNY